MILHFEAVLLLTYKPEDFKFHGQQFFGSVPRDHGKPLVTVFWFGENSWEPTFISFNAQKCVGEHTFKLKNIGVYYYLQQKRQYLLKCHKMVNLRVKMCCTKCQKFQSHLIKQEENFIAIWECLEILHFVTWALI